jgi:hypothetical protein
MTAATLLVPRSIPRIALILNYHLGLTFSRGVLTGRILLESEKHPSRSSFQAIDVTITIMDCHPGGPEPFTGFFENSIVPYFRSRP